MTDLPPPPGSLPDPPADPPAVASAPRSAAPVLIGVAAVALVVIAAAAVVFYKQKQDQARYCEVYDHTHAPLSQALKEANAALAGSRTLSGTESGLARSKAAIDRMNGLLAERRDAAPGSLKDPWNVLIDGPSSDESLSAKKAKNDAQRAVNDYARDVCGLDGDM